MLSVRHERPSQRLQHRVSVPIKVEVIGEGEFDSLNWSLNGLALKDYTGQREEGEKVELEISIPFQGFDISFTCESEVIRLADSVLALNFTAMDDRGRDLLTHFVEEVVRGSVTSTDEILRRIDTPVTPVTSTEAASDSDALPLKRVSWKVVRMVMTHLLVGFVVLGYGGYFIYQNFFMLNVATAVVSAPLSPLLSPINGYLVEVVAQSGQSVASSEVLMRLRNPELDQEIDFAKIAVDRKMMELRTRRGAFRAELQKSQDFKILTENKLAMVEEKLEHLKTKDMLEDMRHEIIEEDFIRGAAGEISVIDSALRRVDADESLDDARNLLRSRRLLLDSIERGVLAHDDMTSKVAETKLAMEFAEDQLVLAQDELSALRKKARWMDVTAPADGQIAEWLRVPGTAIKKGEQLAVFEHNESRVVSAFLTPAEVLQVGLGDPATVYFPSLDRYAEAIVREIDASNGGLNPREVDYIWREPDQPSARVTIEFSDIDKAEIRQNFPAGLPATVAFSQRPTDSSHPLALLAEAGSWFVGLFAQQPSPTTETVTTTQTAPTPEYPARLGTMPKEYSL